mmetsp:Transcript_98958/g.302551  ORF Transcript_98958/g.302551 Transcript_98958/m.302551 type:complete len:331 (+) Transcript_98958:356-1348(+)
MATASEDLQNELRVLPELRVGPRQGVWVKLGGLQHKGRVGGQQVADELEGARGRTRRLRLRGHRHLGAQRGVVVVQRQAGLSQASDRGQRDLAVARQLLGHPPQDGPVDAHGGEDERAVGQEVVEGEAENLGVAPHGSQQEVPVASERRVRELHGGRVGHHGREHDVAVAAELLRSPRQAAAAAPHSGERELPVPAHRLWRMLEGPGVDAQRPEDELPVVAKGVRRPPDRLALGLQRAQHDLGVVAQPVAGKLQHGSLLRYGGYHEDIVVPDRLEGVRDRGPILQHGLGHGLPVALQPRVRVLEGVRVRAHRAQDHLLVHLQLGDQVLQG